MMEILLETFLSYYYLLAAVGVFLVSLALVYIRIRPEHVYPKVPGPKRHLFLGITFSEASELLEGNIFNWDKWPTLTLALSRWFDFQTWGGPTINLGGFGGAFFNIVSPVCLQYILHDNFDNYAKGERLTKSFQELLGKVAFTTDGEAWKFHRKIVVATLNWDTVRYGADVLLEKLEQIEGLLDKKSDTEEVFDFQDLSYSMILDVFVKIGFGFDLNGIGSDHTVSFVDAFDEIQLLIHQRLKDFSWEFKQRHGIGKREKQIKHCGQIIDDFADEIITATRSRDNHDRPDIVSTYLRYCEDHDVPAPTNQELRDLVISMVLAGRDTTAAALTWTIYELTKNPEVVRRIREEVDKVCRGRALSVELVHKLPYTHAVVMEALRLHPPVPDTFRLSKNADMLPDGTHIPAGLLVMFSINSINNSERLWKDPETFNPNRFLDGTMEPSQFKCPTFSGGPRVCPGKPLAMMELKLCLAFLMPRYDFVDIDNHSGDSNWTLVMSMKGGLNVKARKRIERKGTLGLHRSTECFSHM